MSEVVQAARAHDADIPETSFWGIVPDAFGAGALPATLTVDVRDWVPRKLAALRCHRTQFGPRHPILRITDEQARRWLGVEYFRRADIPGVAGSMLESISEAINAR
jgi:LmbE family N-acetylglucosaminyl deacetylase